MKRAALVAWGALGALALIIIPAIMPAGPTSGLDAGGLLDRGQLVVAAGAIFLGGLLTSLTPCVYPLIPITVGVFGARSATGRGQALLLTSAYVGGMGVVFSALGVFAALSGRAFGSVLGSAWLVAALAAFLVLLATSMFGAFELALPTAWATKLGTVGGGGLVGALLMGSVAGFVAAPCTGPVLTGVLAWVARTQDPVLGALLLFVYAMGIGVPFFLIGVFTVRLPRSGAWMEWVKSVFGIALLALALLYVRDAFPAVRDVLLALANALGRSGTMVAVAALAFFGLLAGAVHASFKEPGQRLRKGAGVVAVLAALMLRLVSTGATEGPQAYRWAMVFRADAANSAKPFEAALEKARAACKPVLIDFFAEWCSACKELDRDTYSARRVLDESERFVSIKVDGTTEHEVLDELYERFNVQGLPTVAFVDPSGRVLADPHVVGYMPPELFLAQMQRVTGSCDGRP